jgi:hypothetical protein
LQQFRNEETPELDMVSNLNVFNYNFKLSMKLWDNAHFDLGTEYLNQDLEASVPLGRGLRSPGASGLAFFAGYRLEKDATEANFGLRAVSYSGPQVDALRFEPRVYISRRFGSQRVSFTAEGTSQLPTTAMVLNSFSNEVNVPTNWQSSLRYNRKLFGATVGATAFYQQTPAENAIRRDFFLISVNNFLEFDPDYAITTTTETRRYGVELEAAGGRRDKGWYYRGSVTLLNAETRQQNGNWTKDRYSSDFIGKLTVGREWPGLDKQKRERTFGLNLALIAHGGERLGIAEPWVGFEAPFAQYFATPNVTDGFINSTGTYFRPDLRLYKTKVRAKTTTTLALDVQNVAGIQNTANIYYDAFLEQPTERFQLGLIPVLSYRIVWR